MKKTLLVAAVASSLLACNTENTKEKTTSNSVEKTSKIENPTEPEATEVWEPKPKEVNVDAETEIPSDAIVLFDGSGFEKWTSSVDSSEVKWTLNVDKSMTVKDKNCHHS